MVDKCVDAGDVTDIGVVFKRVDIVDEYVVGNWVVADGVDRNKGVVGIEVVADCVGECAWVICMDADVDLFDEDGRDVVISVVSDCIEKDVTDIGMVIG